MMSTTTQLEHWATGNTPLYNNATFLGVFPSDRLPDPESVAARAHAALIVNYDPHDSPGSHWCAATVMPTTVAWFDSYGLPPDAPDLLLGHTTNFRRWLARVCEQLHLPAFSWNTADLQGWSTKTCGHWSLYFCQQGPWGWGEFGPDRDKNDRHIQELVELEDQGFKRYYGGNQPT